MSLLRFKSRHGADVYIESERIVGIREKEEKETYVFVAVGHESEEWVVSEPVQDVLEKINNTVMPALDNPLALLQNQGM